MLNIAIIQTKIHWENINKNRANLESLCISIKEHVDLIVFPEMCTTGFSMNAKTLAETIEGDTIQWLTVLAKLKKSSIVGSFIIEEAGSFYNRMIWMHPNGSFEQYDKRHLFPLANEQKVYTPGKTRTIVELKGYRINLNICYDLRFPVWSRNQGDYDVLINVANWPSQRSTVWSTLLKARAIENQCFVIGCNRIGTDNSGNHYTGDSAVVNFDGDIIISNSGEESILYAKIDIDSLYRFRMKQPFGEDRDTFSLSN